jgi:hypothetical protein
MPDRRIALTCWKIHGLLRWFSVIPTGSGPIFHFVNAGSEAGIRESSANADDQ